MLAHFLHNMLMVIFTTKYINLYKEIRQQTRIMLKFSNGHKWSCKTDLSGKN